MAYGVKSEFLLKYIHHEFSIHQSWPLLWTSYLQFDLNGIIGCLMLLCCYMDIALDYSSSSHTGSQYHRSIWIWDHVPRTSSIKPRNSSSSVRDAYNKYNIHISPYTSKYQIWVYNAKLRTGFTHVIHLGFAWSDRRHAHCVLYAVVRWLPHWKPHFNIHN